jgi:hypothetical protein
MCLWFFVNFNKNEAVQRKWKEFSTFLATAAGQFCLRSYWLAAGIWAFPSGFPITLSSVHCPTAFNSISQWLSAKTLQFPFPLNCYISIYRYTGINKNQSQIEKLLKASAGPFLIIFSRIIALLAWLKPATLPLSLAKLQGFISWD